MDAELEQSVKARLIAHDHRYTTGRRSIVAALVAAGGPVTIPDLLALDPSMSMSSTYRNLALMEEAGIVQRLVHGSDPAHYELAEDLTEHHHHFICEQCGEVRDITFDTAFERSLNRRFERLADQDGLVTHRHTIDVYGLCPACGDGSSTIGS